MEIEVNEYIRTDNGAIGKLIRIERDDTSLKWYVFYDGKNERYINKPYIVKHSHNIIDLIEVGDILEIKESNDIYYLGLEKDTETMNYNDIREGIKNGECQLLSILTKEKFAQNCYEVEG